MQIFIERQDTFRFFSVRLSLLTYTEQQGTNKAHHHGRPTGWTTTQTNSQPDDNVFVACTHHYINLATKFALKSAEESRLAHVCSCVNWWNIRTTSSTTDFQVRIYIYACVNT